MQGCKEGRKEGCKEGRKEGCKEGRKEGRKEGKKEGRKKEMIGRKDLKIERNIEKDRKKDRN